VLAEHLTDHYAFYGEHSGVRIARKHIGWYIDGWAGDVRSESLLRLRDAVNTAERPEDQLGLLDEYLHHAHDETAFH
jgi:tRNA-dihydrouridine synthase B